MGREKLMPDRQFVLRVLAILPGRTQQAVTGYCLALGL
jgi:hypothetical protein